MKHTYLFAGILSLALLGCEKNETDKEIHFGPSPGDGEVQDGEEAKELHFGPSPGDGAVDKPEERLLF